MTPLAVTVDRRSPVPLYFQVAEQIEREIVAGRLAPGAKLPNEIVLADQLSLSRPTMRQAIQYLVDKGLLVRKRGVGTQVVQSQVRRSIELSSLYDDLVRAGQHPTTVVRDLRLCPAPEEAAAALGLPAEAEVLRIRRLRYAQDEPLALMTNYLPPGLVDVTAEQLQANGLYAVLRGAGIQLRVARQTIGACAASAAQAKDLHESKGAALLTMTRTAYDDVGRAVEYGSHVYRAARYAFELTLIER
ncbi:GntR family transcriptional regulator [Actinopolymorpha singaporensis]|uniref:DNA-binding transcriptional regulator, GntR family n=1 Tax=Actinopolymorpha singaporensis TaxID=117157 RepID=A0A1H1X9K0_9ACTN|nr:GntR family transcriptional regulator [Actinopolymorpha singaporensis]SDT05975.1 DNA-binding transcriptional regulator, GntR family [Actinopolymorpha singaporensis]